MGFKARPHNEDCKRCETEHRFYGTYPSVTTTLRFAFGDPFAEAEGRFAIALAHGAERGTQVHRACALLAGGVKGRKLKMDSLDDEVGPRVEGFARFMELTGYKAYGAEIVVRSEAHRYAGRLDQLGCDNSGELFLEIKATKMTSRIDCLQLGAYYGAFRQMNGAGRGGRRTVLYLHPDFPEGFKAVLCKDVSDLHVFLAALSCFNWAHA